MTGRVIDRRVGTLFLSLELRAFGDAGACLRSELASSTWLGRIRSLSPWRKGWRSGYMVESMGENWLCFQGILVRG
jgi:hypothetical protein